MIFSFNPFLVKALSMYLTMSLGSIDLAQVASDVGVIRNEPDLPPYSRSLIFSLAKATMALTSSIVSTKTGLKVLLL